MKNFVQLFGRIGKIETVTFDGGSLTKLSVATDESYKDKQGNKVDKTEWHNVIYYGKAGEIVAKYFSKGQRILLTGKLQTRSWEKEGQKHYTTEIIANTFEFIEKNESSGNQKSAVPPTVDVSGDDGQDDLPFS